ncbi:MAG: Smr/MutS family protein [Flavobacteriaceae bacterium]|nr:Smr/MutS family protein [Flavobacteriaceae bacterium]
MFGSSKGFDNIDLHGIRHKEAMEMVREALDNKKSQGSFSLTIITGNSTVLQDRIFKEILELTKFNYYIPSWNLGQIIVEYVVL